MKRINVVVRKVLTWLLVSLRTLFGGGIAAGATAAATSTIARASEGSSSSSSSSTTTTSTSTTTTTTTTTSTSTSCSSSCGSEEGGGETCTSSSSSSSTTTTTTTSSSSSSSSCSSCSSGSDDEGDNPFRARDGNAHRTISDLDVKGSTKRGYRAEKATSNAGILRATSGGKTKAKSKVGSKRRKNMGLDWQRYQATKLPENTKSYFGSAGNWRHSWQYDLYQLDEQDPQSNLIFVDPKGFKRTFKATGAGGEWKAADGRPGSIAKKGQALEVSIRGAVYRFDLVEQRPGVAKSDKYQMTKLTNSHGLVTNLQYDRKGWLKQVTEPGGRNLSLAYRDVPLTTGRRLQFATIKQASASGQWVEYTVPTEYQDEMIRHLRFRAADHAAAALAEVQFYAPGSSTPLTGTVMGSEASASLALDGKSDTSFEGDSQRLSYCGLDLGANGSKVSKIRVLAKAGQEASLLNGVLEGYTAQSTQAHVLAEVQTSDGRIVTYDYAPVSDTLGGISYLGLVNAGYGDQTKARYTYTIPNAGSRPLLTEADDPRYDGKLKHVKYAYREQNFESMGGAIYQEKNGANDAVLATLVINPSEPNKRVVQYGDLRTVSYKVAPSKSGELRVLERTDSQGRTKKFEYGNANLIGRITRRTVHTGKVTDKVRDDEGRLLQVKKDGKVRKEITRDEKGRVQGKQVKGKNKHGHQIQRDESGRRTQRLMKDGRVAETTRDGLGKLTKRVTRQGKETRFETNNKGLRTAKIDVLGNKTTYTHDKHDRLASKTDPLGRTTRFERNERGQITQVTYADGRTIKSSYDKYGNKTAVTGKKGRTIRFQHDEIGRVVKRTDQAGRATAYEYAQLPGGCGCSTLAERPTSIVMPNGMATKILYDTEGKVIAKTRAAGTPESATITYSYDDRKNLTKQVDPMGRELRHTYDKRHKRLSTTDALGRTTLYSYDNKGRLTRTTKPDGNAITRDYDKRGRLVKTTDVNGQSTKMKYDREGNVTERILGNGDRYAYDYDKQGRLVTTTHPDNRKETIEYNAVGQVLERVSSDGVKTKYTYDLGGRVTKQVEIDSKGKSREQTYAYNTQGRRTEATDALGRTTRWTYNDHGNVLSTTYPDGRVVTKTYDERNRLLTVTDANGGKTRYTYDSAGNKASLTDPQGNVYRFTYDGQRRKTAMIYPDGSKEQWKYDLSGRLVSYINRSGQVRTITSNEAGQPVAEAWENPASGDNLPILPDPVTYQYDRNGRLAQADNKAIKLSYEYDAAGRAISEKIDARKVVPGMKPHSVRTDYDERGRRSEQKLIEGDDVLQRLRYNYDGAGRLASLDDGTGKDLVKYGYDDQGRVDEVKMENGVKSRYARNDLDQLLGISHRKGEETLSSVGYTLDINGRRTSQTRENGQQEYYSYDAEGQLTQVSYGINAVLPASESFAYDLSGNRTQSQNVARNGTNVTQAYQANSLNQYTQVNTQVFTYDRNGNLLDDGLSKYTYDAQNRLVRVITAGVRADFAYDTRNRCIVRRYYTQSPSGAWVPDSEESRVYTYDRYWRALAERNLNGKLVAKYAHGMGTDAIIRAELADGNGKLQAYYPMVDSLGSTRALADDKGNIVERYAYSVYGDPQVLKANYTPKNNPIGYRYLFTGREWLGRLQLNDHRNRYYSPSLGRWLNTDPIGFAGGDVNLYRYVANKTPNRIDALGLIDLGIVNFSFTENGIEFKFIIYGNFGGPGWFAGQWISDDGSGDLPQPGDLGYEDPADYADACFRDHDNCFHSCKKQKKKGCIEDTGDCYSDCDHALADCLYSDPDANLFNYVVGFLFDTIIPWFFH